MRARRKFRSATLKDYRLVRIFFGALLLLGPIFILIGVTGNYRDRPTLHWPVTTGTMLYCQSSYHPAKYSYYDVGCTYSYFVDDRQYMGHRIESWNPKFKGDRKKVKKFVADYHRGAQVDVHYDPQHPENSVLIPGADETRNQLGIWCGSIILVLSAFLNFRVRPAISKMIAHKKPRQVSARKGASVGPTRRGIG